MNRLERSKRWCGLAVAALVGFSGMAAPARAQVSVDDRVNALAEAVKKKSDDQACTIIDGLAQGFAAMSDDDKKKAIAAVEKCLNAHRDDNDDKLFEAVVNSFANMGDLGEKATVRNLKAASVDKRRGVLAAALRSLAYHKNLDDVKTLTDYLKNSEPTVVAGAADGLGSYADQAEKVRKPIVDELIKSYTTFASAATQAGASAKDKGRAKDKLNVVEKAFLSSLEKLTGQTFKDAPAAQEWFNKNKSNKWPDPPAKKE